MASPPISKASVKPPLPPLIIRPAVLTDAPQTGVLAARVNRHHALTRFLSPRVETYYADYERGFIQRRILQLLDPRCLAYVACFESAPSVIIGYVIFNRVGDDEGAKKYLRTRRVFGLMLLAYVFRAWLKVFNLLWGDRSADKDALATFAEVDEVHQARYWDEKKFPERRCRWHGQSVCVDEKWQGMGIGKRLMTAIMRKAEEEKVVAGLEATAAGERLYRSLGFELLGRYEQDFEDGEGGGSMLWTPEKVRKKWEEI